MATGQPGTKFQIVGELVDHISPGLKEIAAKNIPELVAAFAALAAVEATRFLAEMVNRAAEVGDQLSKMSQITGATTESLSGMRLILDQVGISLEQYGDAHKELNKKLTEAQDPTSKIANTLKFLGINSKDAAGNIKNADQVIRELADTFEKSKDGPGKVAAAMELLGESGVRLIPVLNQGSKALDEFAKKNRELGLEWNGKQSEAANLFKDSLTTLSDAMKGFGEIITKDLIEKLATIVEYLAESAQEGGILRGVLDGLASLISGPVGAALDFLSTILSTIAFGFQLVGKFAGASMAAIRFAAEGDLKKANEVFEQFNKDMDETWERYKKFNDEVWNGRKDKPAASNDGKKDLGDLGAQAKKELDQYTAAMAGLNKELAQAGQSGKAMEVLLETQYGQLRFLTAAHKAALVEKAREIDLTKIQIDLAKQLEALTAARLAKLNNTFTTNGANFMEDPKARAGWMEAEMQRTQQLQALEVKRAEVSRIADKETREGMLAKLDAQKKLFEAGGVEYENAKKVGEEIYRSNVVTKAYLDTVGQVKNQITDLVVQQEEYKKMLDSGRLSQELYDEAMKKTNRTIEDLTNNQTAAGRALQSIIVNRRGIDDTRNAMESIRQAFKDGKVSAAEYEYEMYNLQQNLDNLNPTFAINQLQRLKDEMRSAAASFESMFSNGIFDMMQGKWSNLGDLVKNTIDRMVANMIAAKIQFALFGDLGSTPAGKTPNSTGLLGGLFTSFFGGFRENGGSVEAGKAYVVGEKRPEVFVPSTNGTILSNASGVTGGPQINLNITAMDSQDVLRAVGGVKRELAQMLSTTNRNYNLRG